MADPAPLVLLHPFPLDARAFDAVAPRLGAGRWMRSPEFPGFGGAPPEERPGIDAFADAVAARVARDAPGGRAVLCGMSMGGYVALAAAARHPETVLGLVLAGTRAEADSAEARAGRAASAARVRREGTGPFLEGFLPRLVGSGPEAGAALRVARAIAGEQPAEAVARALEALGARSDRVADLTGIAAPALVISGGADAAAPPEVMAALAAGLPDARTVTLAGAGHLAALERPDAFAEAVLPFLEGLAGP
jgi:pimeloyl-ACP methyl ester carboxylesterase